MVAEPRMAERVSADPTCGPRRAEATMAVVAELPHEAAAMARRRRGRRRLEQQKQRGEDGAEERRRPGWRPGLITT